MTQKWYNETKVNEMIATHAAELQARVDELEMALAAARMVINESGHIAEDNERLERQVAELLALLRRLEFVEDSYGGFCPSCNNDKRSGHMLYCELDTALTPDQDDPDSQEVAE